VLRGRRALASGRKSVWYGDKLGSQWLKRRAIFTHFLTLLVCPKDGLRLRLCTTDLGRMGVGGCWFAIGLVADRTVVPRCGAALAALNRFCESQDTHWQKATSSSVTRWLCKESCRVGNPEQVERLDMIYWGFSFRLSPG
jgi:hypothetical protein